MKATAFVTRSSTYASTMLASRGEPYRGAIKRDDRRCARHSHNAEVAAISLSELRKDFGLQPMPQREREFLSDQLPNFQPSFLLADRPAPTQYREVTVTRKRVSQRKPVVETLVLAA